MTHRRRVAAATAVLLALGGVLAGCGSRDDSSVATPPPHTTTAVDRPDTTSYDAARSTPATDSVYPQVGGRGVDALHYDLQLEWDSTRSTLTGTESLLFQASASVDRFQLDLARQLTVGHVWLDGDEVDFSHDSKDLVVHSSVDQGDQHLLQLTYSGVPEPVTAPTDRSDFSTTGWTTTSDGGAWTMQEPYGAYSWFAVDDQPADKAFYDIRIDAPAPMVGVANGRLLSRRTSHHRTVTRWRLPEPAASYLITAAIGRYRSTRDTGPHGLPITYWTPAGQPRYLKNLRYTPKAVAYLESKLGRYPFPTLAVLLVPSLSAMETQSTLTIGTGSSYSLSKDVLVHELAHQWYGDEVTPADWSDVWMSEGMALYLAEGHWTADHTHQPIDSILSGWAQVSRQLRTDYGPPADYHPGSFGEGNVYYVPALMWDTIRQRLGDRLFWRLVREWPRSQRFSSRGRDDLAAWWSKESGQDLTPLFHSWLLGARQPAWRADGSVPG